MAFKAKRQHPRASLREGIKVRTAIGIEYGTFDDLSIGGLKLFLDHAKREGEVVDLEFRVASGMAGQIKVLGRVVRCLEHSSGYEVGIEFVNIAASMRDRITKLFDTGEGPY